MIDEKDPGRESVSADDSDEEVIIDLTDEVIIKPEDENRVLTLTEDMADDSPKVPETEKLSDPVSDEEESVLDLERGDDTQDFASMVLARSQTSDPLDDEYDPTQYLELETEELDDIVLPEDEREDEPEALATPNETDKLVDDEELPDIETVGDLDLDEILDDINDADDRQGLDTAEPASSDDILASVGQAAGPLDNSEAEFAGKAGTLGLDEVENFPGLMDPAEADQEMVPLTDDEPLVFEDETDAFDLEEELDPDADDEVIPLDGLNDRLDDQEEEVIEITEFDQHYPVEGETLLKRTGVLDPSSTDEDDFLELIDVEEDILSQDQEVVEFGETPMADAGESVNRFMEAELEETESQSTDSESTFNDDVEDQILEKGISESEPEVFLNDNDGILQEEGIDLSEERSEPDIGLPDEDSEIQSTPEALFSESENFDFNTESGNMAKQVVQPDSFLTEDQNAEPERVLFPSDHPEAEGTEESPTDDDALTGHDAKASTAIPAGPVETALFADERASEEIASDDARAEIDSDEFPSVPVAQIDATIERVIIEKFGDKIEDIIYDVIEKAVTKEISRLKSALLGDNEPE